MKLIVVIPALNEVATVGDVVRGVPCEEMSLFDEVEVLVVDDGSTDETARVAADAGASVIANGRNRGLGYTFSRGIREAVERCADVIVTIDGDGQFDPSAIPKLTAPIVNNEADFVTASRFADREFIPSMPKAKLWGNRVMSWLIGGMIRQKVYDVSCGFRAYSLEAALRLNVWGRFTYTQEVFLDLGVKDMRIKEVPVQVTGVRPVGESRIANSIWRYALQTAMIIFRSYRDYWPLRFFGWSACPFFLLGGGLVVFFGIHYVQTGSFSPHIWAGFAAAALIFAGIINVSVGIVTDMLKRIRLNQEELVYRQRLLSLRSKGEDEENGEC